MPKPLLHAGKQRLLVSCLDIDHPIWRQPDLSQCRREEVGSGHAPEDFAFGSGSNATCEQCRSGTVDRAIAAPGHFVKRTIGQSAFRQPTINRRHAERKNCPLTNPSTLQPIDTIAQFGDDRIEGAVRHRKWCPPRALQRRKLLICSLFVLNSKLSQSTITRLLTIVKKLGVRSAPMSD